MLFVFSENGKEAMKIRSCNVPKYFLFLFLITAIIFPVSLSYSQTVPDITNEDFKRMLRDISEYGGYFPSDNWVSNEIKGGV